MASDGESLESWLNKATNPSNRQEDWGYIMGFCDQVNKELEGPQISVKLLVHKIQSPQELEAVQALTVLEACMKNCGRRFHNEVGKFRFLNELIKVISPKYLVSERVKTKVITMLYSWTVSLPDEAKICEAYHLLKSQGIVLADPKIPVDAALILSPSQRPKKPVFDDKIKNKKLAQLLKSKTPEDLQEANRLVKNMVKEDEVRTQKATKQKSTLEAVDNSVKLFNEMLAHFSPVDSADGDKELIRELYGNCDRLRQTVSQVATETEDNDSSLGDILQASDDLSLVINSYKTIVEGPTINEVTETLRQGTSCTNHSEILIDLVDINTKSVPVIQQQPLTSSASIPADLLWGSVVAEPCSAGHSTPSAAHSLLNEKLLSSGLNELVPVTSKSTHINLSNHLQSSEESSQALALFGTCSSSVPACSTTSLYPDVLSTTTVGPTKSSSTTPFALNLKEHAFSMPQVSLKSLSTTSPIFPKPLSSVLTTTIPGALTQSFSLDSPAYSATPVPPLQVFTSSGASLAHSASLNHNLQHLTLLDLSTPNNHGVSSTTSTSMLVGEMPGGLISPPNTIQAEDTSLLHCLSPIPPLNQASQARGQEEALVNVFVPLDAIKPSQMRPVTAYDKNGIRVMLHFATDCPAGRPDVRVIVASMLSTALLPVRDILLQAAVPKMMKVRLQQPSGTELAPFNPFHPPAYITQVMLLANPFKEKVRMRYKLTFTLGEQSYTEVGEVNEFPCADTWRAL